MSKTLTVNNTPFEYPTAGEEPGWGSEATAWASEVTDVLDGVLGPDDLLETTVSISNNISTNTNIVGLVFDTGSVRSAVIEYSVYRVSDSSTSGNAETGIITIVYDNSAAVNEKWSMTVGNISGNSGITLSITDAGQFQYQSTDIGSTNYSGTMKFLAKATGQ